MIRLPIMSNKYFILCVSLLFRCAVLSMVAYRNKKFQPKKISQNPVNSSECVWQQKKQERFIRSIGISFVICIIKKYINCVCITKF